MTTTTFALAGRTEKPFETIPQLASSSSRHHFRLLSKQVGSFISLLFFFADLTAKPTINLSSFSASFFSLTTLNWIHSLLSNWMSSERVNCIVIESYPSSRFMTLFFVVFCSLQIKSSRCYRVFRLNCLSFIGCFGAQINRNVNIV